MAGRRAQGSAGRDQAVGRGTVEQAGAVGADLGAGANPTRPVALPTRAEAGVGGGSVQCVPPQDCPPGTIKSATVASSVCDPVCGGTGGDCLSNKNACF